MKYKIPNILEHELVFALPHENELLVLEKDPVTTRYLRVVCSDGTELAYYPVPPSGEEAILQAVLSILELGSAAVPAEASGNSAHRNLVKCLIPGFRGYDFADCVFVAENDLSIPVTDLETLYDQLCSSLGVTKEAVPARSQRTADLCVQLLHRTFQAIGTGRQLLCSRLHPRLLGLEHRHLRVTFADQGTETFVLRQTEDFPPRHCRIVGTESRPLDPLAQIVRVEILEPAANGVPNLNTANQQEPLWKA